MKIYAENIMSFNDLHCNTEEKSSFIAIKAESEKNTIPSVMLNKQDNLKLC
jgi:hypothetical protein